MSPEAVSGALIGATYLGCAATLASVTRAPRATPWLMLGAAGCFAAGVAVGLAGRVGLI